MNTVLQVYVCHAAEVSPRCEPLVAVLRAWGVQAWFDPQPLAGAGQGLSQQSQEALTQCHVLLRVCSVETPHSYWMGIETGAFLSLQAKDFQQGRPNARRVVNLIIDRKYVPEPFDRAAVTVDALRLSPTETSATLRSALGLPPAQLPDGTVLSFDAPRKPRRISRRVAISSGVAVVTAAGAVSAGAVLAERSGRLPVLPNFLRVSAQTSHQTPTPSVRDSKLAWWYRTNDEIRSDPILAAGAIVVSSLRTGSVYAVNAVSGRLKWAAQLDGQIVSAPAVAQDIMYFAEFAVGIHSVNAETGARLRTLPVNVGATAPVVEQNTFYAGTRAGLSGPQPLIVTGNVASGNMQSSKAPDAECWAGPVVTGTTVFAGSREGSGADGNLYALDISQGLQQKWKLPTGKMLFSTPVYSQDSDTVFAGAWNGTLYAVNATSGAIRWKATMPGNIEGTPVLGNGLLYITSSGGGIYAYDASTGTPAWNFPMTKGSIGTATIANGVLYIGGNDHAVHALDPRTGHELTKYATGGSITNKPLVVNGHLYVGCADKFVYAFKL